MNKQELIENIATSADITKAAAGRALDSIIDSITGSLKNGDLRFSKKSRVIVHGFIRCGKRLAGEALIVVKI